MVERGSTNVVETRKTGEPPINEWVLTSIEDVRACLKGMMAKRRWNQERLATQMGTSSIFSPFLRGLQDNMKILSFIRAVLAMEFELVVREPTTSKSQRRLAALRAEKERLRAEQDERIRQITVGITPADR